MIIEKIINNNFIYCHDDSGNELIVAGCGVAFGKRKGDRINEGKIQKIYRIDKQYRRHCKSSSPVSSVWLKLTEDIVVFAQKTMNCRYSGRIYTILPKYLYLMNIALNNGTSIQRSCICRLIKEYPGCAMISTHASEAASSFANIKLPETEACFISLFFAAEEQTGTLSEISDADFITYLMKNIYREMCCEALLSDLPELRINLRKLVNMPENINAGIDQDLDEYICRNYTIEYLCAMHTAALIRIRNQKRLSDYELSYLTQLINRTVVQSSLPAHADSFNMLGNI